MGTITTHGASDDQVIVFGDIGPEQWDDSNFFAVGGRVVVSTGDEITVTVDGTGAWTADHTVQDRKSVV